MYNNSRKHNFQARNNLKSTHLNHGQPQTKMTAQQKESQILYTINQATNEQPLTYKGIAVMTGLQFDEIRAYCEKLLGTKQINQVMISDAQFPTQKVRAFFKKY